MPGITSCAPARQSATVSIPAAATGGANVNANLRAGLDQNACPIARALSRSAIVPITKATHASTSQTNSHRDEPGWRLAINPAAMAVTPIQTPPQPGTAVNLFARSDGFAYVTEVFGGLR